MTADRGLRGLDLLDAAIAHIEAHPGTWYQASWRCGSGVCLAGHMAELAGGTWLTPADSPDSVYLAAEAGEVGTLIQVPGGEVRGTLVSLRAERLLGVPPDMRSALEDTDDERDLFDADNTLDDIKAMRDDLRAAAGDAA